jgi:hypothetical protein
MVCANCNAPLDDGEQFCGNCGAAAESPEKKCGNCGAQLKDGQKFCTKCGTQTGGGAPALAAQTQGNEIYIDNGDGTGGLFEFSFSNSLSGIGRAIKARTKIKADLDNIAWKRNPRLSPNVKKEMVERGAEYSMTTFVKENGRAVVINRRVENEWFTYTYNIAQEVYARMKTAKTIRNTALAAGGIALAGKFIKSMADAGSFPRDPNEFTIHHIIKR